MMEFFHSNGRKQQAAGVTDVSSVNGRGSAELAGMAIGAHRLYRTSTTCNTCGQLRVPRDNSIMMMLLIL
jgi:hypothetical protein